MHDDVTPTRRHVVAAGAAGLAAAALSACSGSSGSATGTTPASSGASGTAGSGGATGTGGAGSSTATGGNPTTVRPPSAGGAAGGQGAVLAKLSDVPVGSSRSVKGSDGTPIVITRPSEGKVVAFSAICTHQGCTVVPAGSKLLCPCHNSTFDPNTGAKTAGIAPAGLPAVAVTIRGGDIVAG